MKLFIARALLALAYPVLAHLAGARGDGTLAALALGDLVLIVLLEPLLRGRAWAWALAVVAGAGLWRLADSAQATLPLLLVPVAVVALVAWMFGRTLGAGRVPLITRIVAALEGCAPEALAPPLRRYTRALTAGWAVLLAALALANLALAAVAVPGGLLDGLGRTPPVAVTRAQWSWFANALGYGVVGGAFVGEYLLRKRLFPGRYHSFADFLHRLARLGPAFWRELLRG